MAINSKIFQGHWSFFVEFFFPDASTILNACTVHKFREKENWSWYCGNVHKALIWIIFFVLLSYSLSVSFISCTTTPGRSVVSTLCQWLSTACKKCSTKITGDDKLFLFLPSPLLHPSVFLEKWQFELLSSLLCSPYIAKLNFDWAHKVSLLSNYSILWKNVVTWSCLMFLFQTHPHLSAPLGSQIYLNQSSLSIRGCSMGFFSSANVKIDKVICLQGLSDISPFLLSSISPSTRPSADLHLGT